MKLFSTLSLLALALAPSALAVQASVEKKDLSRRALGPVVGYASLNGGTTGGAGGSSVTVTDLKGLTAAVTGDAKKTVYISGTSALQLAALDARRDE
jgi:pectate lyase